MRAIAGRGKDRPVRSVSTPCSAPKLIGPTPTRITSAGGGSCNHGASALPGPVRRAASTPTGALSRRSANPTTCALEGSIYWRSSRASSSSTPSTASRCGRGRSSSSSTPYRGAGPPRTHRTAAPLPPLGRPPVGGSRDGGHPRRPRTTPSSSRSRARPQAPARSALPSLVRGTPSPPRARGAARGPQQLPVAAAHVRCLAGGPIPGAQSCPSGWA